MGGPGLGEAAELAAELRAEARREGERQKMRRIQAFRKWQREDWAGTRSGVYQWVRGAPPPRAAALRRSDGSFTANAKEMDVLLQEAWGFVFRMYADKPEPEWEPFLARFGAHLPPRRRMGETELTREQLFATLRRMKRKSAAGMDAWSVDELRALPMAYWDRPAALLRVVETTGRWPAALARGLLSLIPKGQGVADPLKQRPVSVMSIVYRLWAATRLGEVIEWQEEWVHSGLHGFRPAHGAEDVYWGLALKWRRRCCRARI
jgi:hypothetical protein